MATREIRIFPDPVLQRPAIEVLHIDHAVRQLMEDMVETMYTAPGVGLAAPQVGESLRIIVVDVGNEERPSELLMLANPAIVSSAGEECVDEGCLSLPDLTFPIRRASSVTVSALGPDGRPLVIEATGLLARALQHEIDHINGTLIHDRLTGLRKELARKKLQKIFCKD